MSKILMMPHKRLSLVSEECDVTNLNHVNHVVSEVTAAFEAIHNAKGLAAVQCGLLDRVIIIKPKHMEATVMINPEIVKSYGKMNSNEGCESCKDRYIVKRPICGIVQWVDVDNVKHKKFFGRDAMRVISHEIDHLNGKLISDVGEHWVYSNVYKQLKKREANVK